ncbi:BED-type domain-containing protein [Trichonephila clavipes]|uniref:BED-type domain-containing protein n=1 Tax=Trichonephila clavipes TaxID=2585209 RepID=A0A8X7BK85_TRICX|nr:BED-type domain-containing protein [Trichonephila clavipes]
MDRKTIDLEWSSRSITFLEAQIQGTKFAKPSLTKPTPTHIFDCPTIASLQEKGVMFSTMNLYADNIARTVIWVHGTVRFGSLHGYDIIRIDSESGNIQDFGHMIPTTHFFYLCLAYGFPYMNTLSVGSGIAIEVKDCSIREKKETLEEIVSKLVCVDGFTVNAITKSNFIRQSLHDKGYSFPPNPSDVMKLVYKQYNVIKARVTNEISSKLNAGLRRSLTLDEFTSLKNRRYLNINVHFNEGEIFILGMLRISGSFSAENCVKAVETKLQEFGIITEKHIVACVTVGASMMVKFGKIMSYLVENTNEVEDKSHEKDNEESEELVEDLDKALDLEFESGVGTDALFHVTYAEKNSITNINETIKKIRNVKLFRKSPIKNDILQKYVKEEFGCEKTVCLDTKTRWNGLIQYLNFGRKYEAAAVTGDISRLPGKNCLVRQAQMIGTRFFYVEEESISNSSHSEEESMEILKEKPLTLDEKN